MAVKPLTFIVPGQEHAPSTRGSGAVAGSPTPTFPRGRLKSSVRVGASRGEGGAVAVQAVPGEDVVVLQIANGPELVLHPEHARDLFEAQRGPGARAARGARAPAADEVTVPIQLEWSGMVESPAARGTSRGIGGVVLSAVHVLSGVAEDAAADRIASEIVRRVDGQVDAGLYHLNANEIGPLKGRPTATNIAPSPGDAPLLVLVHGTFSTTAGTFSNFWINHPEHVRALFKRYDDRVFGLDHPTLGVSPIANALTLAEALPAGARLHLLTHSRGGLVAETLARIAGDPDDDFAEFAGRAYAEQRAQLRTLAALVRKKRLRVDRVVRVACPARGTLLASKRLDAYVSVFKWTLELAGIPVAPELLDFLSAVAQRRADPALMPGLAAQVPDSPLVRWLHAVERQVDGDLRVIAGDLQGDSISSWLKTLLTDAYYWTDHDLVVQTRSMYGGSPRRTKSTFVLDQGGKVSHFNYFTNDRTAEAIANALLQDVPRDFGVIGPLSWSGQSAAGTRARIGRAKVTTESGRPAVFILPGILGSNLRIGDDRIWIGWRLVNGFTQLAYTGGRKDRVEPDGMVGSVYDDLAAFLGTSHEVIEFPFDWRRPIEGEARRLATAVSTALDARTRSGQPVRMVAHSMGGLVARAMQLERPDIWKRMLDHESARVLMLGTPNAGSWVPMQVLSGDDTFGNLLALVGAPFQEHEARQVMAALPGFLQLQAGLLDPNTALASARTWQRLADDDWARAQAHCAWHGLPIQLDALRWGVPPQPVLDAAVALRRRLDEQAQSLDTFGNRVLLVVGHAPFTADRFEATERGLVYTGSPFGDGRVTLESAMLPGVPTWRVPCEHGKLPERKDAFVAYRELLDRGSTSLIESVAPAPATRGTVAPTLLYARPARAMQKATPPRAEDQALETTGMEEPAEPIAAAIPPLRVTVHNGDLTFVRYPLLLGHYRSMRLTGTEYVMDRWIGHVMEQSLQVGTYPHAVGTSRIFINRKANPRNPFQLPRPEAVIVAGLGEEAKLSGTALVSSVRQAVLAWAERQAEPRDNGPAEIELATTLIGSGGSGISAGQSAQLVAQGVYEANDRLARERAAHAGDGDWPSLGRVTQLHIIELYLDRATEALHALAMQADATPGRFSIDAAITVAPGGLERPVDAGYRGADYDYISALTRVESDGTARIEYTLDTRRARTEVRAQHPQSTLLRHLVTLASNDTNSDPRIGRTLFQLLVPIEIEPYLAGSTDMQIEVDSGTAGIPWELLDTDRDGAERQAGGRGTRDGSEPWAIRTKLLRKLRVQDPPERLDAGTDGSALIIGEPKCDSETYPRLPGARVEAQRVCECLAANTALGADRVQALISPDDPQRFGPDAKEVLNAVFDRDRTWRIIHIAGHGEPAQGTEPGGVVLSDGFFSAREIKTMRVVPELVFVNCCFLAARSGDQLLRGNHDRAQFAAGVAEELINIGVRCVVAAGWAVDDAAAGAFASTFYASLLGGRRFLDAVSDARKAARTFGGNTWAAYQCYGDPDWRFRRDTPDAQRPSLESQFQGVLSASGLARAVGTLAVQSEYQGAPPELQRDKLRFLEERARRSAPEWLRLGFVAEAFGQACAAADDLPGAIRWYREAVAAADGTASLKTAEQLANLRARVAGESVEAAQAAVLAGEKSAAARLRETIAAARTELADATAALERLVALHPTLERVSFLGSVMKRRAMIEAAAGDEAAELQALTEMQSHYRQAQELASQDEHAEFYYPALNQMAADAALHAGTPEWKGLAADSVARIRQELEDRVRTNPDFWSVVGQSELRSYEALAAGDLHTAVPKMLEAWRDLHARVPSQHKWKSVYDTARMVLTKYARRVSGAERSAAEHLLGELAAMAGIAPEVAREIRRAEPVAGRSRARKRPAKRRTGRPTPRPRRR